MQKRNTNILIGLFITLITLVAISLIAYTTTDQALIKTLANGGGTFLLLFGGFLAATSLSENKLGRDLFLGFGLICIAAALMSV